ncbi:rhodanese-like domain-containing protein [Pontibacter sp. JAM-7]|uniref:rhodanese-like domain-containing protein n=1 Tax=Pontibacter sp. JAM-7 TaxID=3366581 RepID=UPI003AF4488E
MRYLLLLIVLSPWTLAGPGSQALTEENTRWPGVTDENFELFSFDGYRLFRYRSPTPQGSDYATTINTLQLQRLLQQDPKPALLDVQPIPWNGVFIQQKPRLHLPGSMWLPNVGQGEPEARWLEYYRKNLKQLSGGDKHYPLVIYCTADCWMSWNAVKRAASLGYSNIFWYRNGTDGWVEHDLPLELAEPESFPP